MEDTTVSVERRATRRGLLAGAFGGAAALVARSLGRIPAAQAANGDPLLVGQSNSATLETSLNTTFGSPASTDNAVHVTTNGDATAVRAVTVSGVGLVASATGVGVGVRGEGTQAVVGDASIAGTGSIGVYGLADGSTTGYGVYGQHGDVSETVWTGEGTGVRGESFSTNGTGVFGQGEQYGVYGQTTDGQAGFFLASGSAGTGVRTSAPSGIALDVNGVAKFTRSGTVSIPAGVTSATVAVGGAGLSGSTLILATMQNDLNNTYVRAAVPNVPADSFTVFLNRPAPANATVGWLIAN